MHGLLQEAHLVSGSNIGSICQETLSAVPGSSPRPLYTKQDGAETTALREATLDLYKVGDRDEGVEDTD